MIDGILVIDKPKGWTSHDVVAKLRGVFGQKRIGHTGTLDPIATGVLPVCLGKATRVSEYMLADDKSYTATLQLGLRTDTLDASGTVTERSDRFPEKTELEAVMAAFKGEQWQTPPMFSAKKKDGVPLYVRARKGEVIERKPNRIVVHSLQLLSYNPPYAQIECRVSKGTYIRSLIDDIGARLGCGAVMTELRRTKSGDFCIEEAISMDALVSMAPSEAVVRLLPLDRALQSVPSVQVTEAEHSRLIVGQTVTTTESECELLRVYADKVFLGPGRVRSGELKLWKVLV